MLASPVSDDIFLFIAAEAASEAESAATGETTDVAPGGEAAPLPAAAAALEEAQTEPAAVAAAAAGSAGRPLAAAAAGSEAWPFSGIDSVESGFFSCERRDKYQ